VLPPHGVWVIKATPVMLVAIGTTCFSTLLISSASRLHQLIVQLLYYRVQIRNILHYYLQLTYTYVYLLLNVIYKLVCHRHIRDY